MASRTHWVLEGLGYIEKFVWEALILHSLSWAPFCHVQVSLSYLPNSVNALPAVLASGLRC